MSLLIHHPRSEWDIEPAARRWSQDEFHRIADLGLFRGQRPELVDGEIMVLSPRGPSHSFATDGVAEAIRNSGWAGVWVRMQLPVDFGPYSEPEPDVSVVLGSRSDYRDRHPSSVLILVEVSDSTLAYDRGKKAGLYAKLGVPDYWIVNLIDRWVEVFRDPRPDPLQPSGFGFHSMTVHGLEQEVSPLSAPAIRLPVRDLLP